MSQPNKTRESGFALILALLALLLLTTMGMALANSTSVELQISTNQRWAESARYNAEAGLEYGKSVLETLPDWSSVLPPARTVADWTSTSWNAATQTSTSGTPIQTRATRNFENWQCDSRGYGMGYGVVYDDGGAAGAEEYRSQIGGATLNGAFTLWIRRPVMWNLGEGKGTALKDYQKDDALLLLAEGVAPYQGAGANVSGFAATNRAVYSAEILLARGSGGAGAPIIDQSACNTRLGQAGGSASGGNTSGCVALTKGDQITEALSGTTDLGTGVLK